MPSFPLFILTMDHLCPLFQVPPLKFFLPLPTPILLREEKAPSGITQPWGMYPQHGQAHTLQLKHQAVK